MRYLYPTGFCKGQFTAAGENSWFLADVSGPCIVAPHAAFDRDREKTIASEKCLKTSKNHWFIGVSHG